MPPHRHQPTVDKTISLILDSYILPAPHEVVPKDAAANKRAAPHLPPLPAFQPLSVPPVYPRPPSRQPSVYQPKPLRPRLLPPHHYLFTNEPSPTFSAPRTAPMPPQTPLYDPLAIVPCNTVTLTTFHTTPMLMIKTTSASATILIVSRLACISVHIAPHISSASPTIVTDLLSEATTLFRQNAHLFPKAPRNSPDRVRSYVIYALVKKKPVLDARQRGEVYERLKELGLGVADASYMLLPPSILKGKLSIEGLRGWGEKDSGRETRRSGENASLRGSINGKDRARTRGTVVVTKPGFIPNTGSLSSPSSPQTAFPPATPTSPTSPTLSISSPISISSPFFASTRFSATQATTSPTSPIWLSHTLGHNLSSPESSPDSDKTPTQTTQTTQTTSTSLPLITFPTSLSNPNTTLHLHLPRITLDSHDLTSKPQKRLIWEYIDNQGGMKIRKYCLMLDGVCVVQRDEPPEEVDVWVRRERKWGRLMDGQWMYWF